MGISLVVLFRVYHRQRSGWGYVAKKDIPLRVVWARCAVLADQNGLRQDAEDGPKGHSLNFNR